MSIEDLEKKGGSKKLNEENWQIELLAKQGEVTNEDISKVEEKVLPQYKKQFDKLSYETKVAFALFEKLTPEEIHFIESLKAAKTMPGLHDLRNHLHLYYIFTGKERVANNQGDPNI